MSDDVAQRAKARAAWPVRKYKLGEEPDEDLSATTTVAERVAMVHQLTMNAWAMSGRAIPTYSRASMPGRIIRRR